MSRRPIDRAFDLVRELRFALAAGLVLLAALGAWNLRALELDMSFRPLFEDDPQALARTQAFEDVFGQVSGARIGAILVHPEIRSETFTHELEDLSERVAGLQGVVEVRSLTRFPRDLPDEARKALLSDDGTATVLWARVGVPLEDLEGRRPIVRAFRRTVDEGKPIGSEAHLVGVSVVEDAYADIVLRGLAVSVGLSTAVILLVLLAMFGQLRSVAICMAGVTLALPITLGTMPVLGYPLTIVGSMVATLVLVIGVADAVHMLNAFLARRAEGRNVESAAREMFRDTGLACLMTTVTTMAGFLSLRFAGLAAIKQFGTAVALGVAAVYLANLIAVPTLLLLCPPSPRAAPRRLSGWIDTGLGFTRRWVRRRPGLTASLAGALFLVGIAALPALTVRQKFNEEVAGSHPVRVAQTMLEEEFGGFLGPELLLRRTDGAELLDDESLRAVSAFQARIAAHPMVEQVRSFLDLLPPETPAAQRGATLAALRAKPELAADVRSLVDSEHRRAALIVRIPDVGTDVARELVDWIEEIETEELGGALEAEVVGQWWLSQLGMSRLVADMVRSFSVACLLVLPILGLTVRSWRLFLVGLFPNVLPMLFALGAMSWAGLSLRIGTAMVLAIALGIAVDDTIHFFVRLRQERAAGRSPHESIDHTLLHTGRAIVMTTLILAVGFLSMTTSEVLAIRDMGIVGALALVAALVADVLLAPALYVLITRRTSGHQPAKMRSMRSRISSNRSGPPPPTSAEAQPS